MIRDRDGAFAILLSGLKAACAAFPRPTLPDAQALQWQGRELSHPVDDGRGAGHSRWLFPECAPAARWRRKAELRTQCRQNAGPKSMAKDVTRCGLFISATTSCQPTAEMVKIAATISCKE